MATSGGPARKGATSAMYDANQGASAFTPKAARSLYSSVQVDGLGVACLRARLQVSLPYRADLIAHAGLGSNLYEEGNFIHECCSSPSELGGTSPMPPSR